MKDELYEVFCEVFGYEKVKSSQHLSKEYCYDWDSLKNVELMVAVETKFEIKFSLEDLEKINSFNDILDILDKEQNAEK